MEGGDLRDHTEAEARQPRLLAQGEITLKSVCGDLPQEEGAIRRAACTAFLLAADAGQVHWHPEHLYRLLYQGAEIQKRQPEAVSNCGRPVQLRTHLTLHTISSKELLALSVTSQEARELLETVTTGCIAEWRDGATAFIKRKPKDLLVFRSGWRSPPKLIQVWDVNGLSSELSKMSHGDQVTLTLLDITRRFGAHDLQPSGQAHDEYRQQLQDLPDYHELSELRSTSATSSPQNLTHGNTTPQDLTPVTTSTRTFTWRVELPGEYDPQDAMVRTARSRVEGRPSGTLREEAVRLAGDTFDWGHPDIVALEGQLQRLVCDLVEAVGRRDPLFAGLKDTLVGSHGDGTDVRRTANEFDILISMAWEGVRVERENHIFFSVAWEEEVVEEEEEEKEGEKEGRLEWRVWVRDETLAACREEGGRKDILTGEFNYEDGVEEGEVDPDDLRKRWADGLDAELSTVTLPEGLTHGGLLSPRYTGVKVGKTTVTLSMVWRGQTRLTCDLTPAVPVPLDTLKGVTQEVICRLERVAGLEPSSHPVHLVPGWHRGRPGWLPTMCVMETHALVALGPRSPTVTRIRGLKLLARHYLQWLPLDEGEVSEARDTLAALGGGGRGSRGSIGGLVDVEGLSERVSESLETGMVRVPERRLGEGWEGRGGGEEAGEGVYWSRVALVVSATHTAHWAGRGAGGCQGKCGLCEDLTGEARILLNWRKATLLHPAVGEAVGVPPSPQLEIRSVVFKHLILGDLLGGEASGDERVRRDEVGQYMKDLATRLERGWGGVPHPLLSGEGVDDIDPVPGMNGQLDTSDPEDSDRTRSEYPVWRWLSPSLRDCHAEVCRQLCDVTQVT